MSPVACQLGSQTFGSPARTIEGPQVKGFRWRFTYQSRHCRGLITNLFPAECRHHLAMHLGWHSREGHLQRRSSRCSLSLSARKQIQQRSASESSEASMIAAIAERWSSILQFRSNWIGRGDDARLTLADLTSSRTVSYREIEAVKSKVPSPKWGPSHHYRSIR